MVEEPHVHARQSTDGVHNSTQLPFLRPAVDFEEGERVDLHDEIRPEQNTGAIADAADQELLKQIFHQEGTVLQLDEPRLKADNKLDDAKRLAFSHLRPRETGTISRVGGEF